MQAQSPDILVIDDDPFLCEIVTDFLEEHDYTCRMAHSGVNGLRLFEERRPDMVLLDIRMPKMTGLDILKILREEAPDMPVIMISGTSDLADIVQILRLGAWDYLMKPITDMELLRHAIEKALERAQLLRDNRRYHEQLEVQVRERTAALQEANTSLERKNAALHELMDTIRTDREHTNQVIASNIEKVILPLLTSLEHGLSPKQKKIALQIRRNFAEITSPFVDTLAKNLATLTPTEIRVCNLIRRGLATKEIAQLESLSAGTISVHRKSIRRKLGIANQKVNMVTFLDSLMPPETA
jgi:DNA-binding NarL/FixJ family response regulator